MLKLMTCLKEDKSLINPKGYPIYKKTRNRVLETITVSPLLLGIWNPFYQVTKMKIWSHSKFTGVK
jgi:hypothetical protein